MFFFLLLFIFYSEIVKTGEKLDKLISCIQAVALISLFLTLEFWKSGFSFYDVCAYMCVCI